MSGSGEEEGSGQVGARVPHGGGVGGALGGARAAEMQPREKLLQALVSLLALVSGPLLTTIGLVTVVLAVIVPITDEGRVGADAG